MLESLGTIDWVEYFPFPSMNGYVDWASIKNEVVNGRNLKLATD